MTRATINTQTDHKYAWRPGIVWGVVLLAVFISTIAGDATLRGQDRAVTIGRPARGVEGAIVLDVRSPADLEALRKENNEKYSGGAALKTDPELEELLKRADLFAQEGNFRNATLLWQKVLSESGDSLLTQDGETYYSLTMEVERTIAQLPADGLRQYRITADGDAQAALSAATSLEDGLTRVVGGYFLSSLGDEAAYKLGCLALDRYDFLSAQRMFRKIVDSYPDPTVPLEQVWLRLAVAAAHMGDKESAMAALQNAGQQGSITADLLELIRRDVETAENQMMASLRTGQKNWPMTLGGPARRGSMPGVPAEALATDLSSLWSFTIPANNFQEVAIPAQIRGGFGGRNVQTNQNTSSNSNSLVEKWKAQGWLPAGRMLISNGRIYFKTNNDLICWNTLEQPKQPVWRSLWLNKYERDEATATMHTMFSNYGQELPKNRPWTAAESFWFGDRIHQDMTVVGNVIYSIEGKRYSRYGDSGGTQQRPVNVQWGMIPRRSRVNWLTAYNATTGKLLWHVTPKSEFVDEDLDFDEDTEDGGLGFMAAPVPFGNLLIVPVTDGGAIWVHALDGVTGETVWTSYLCDEPAGVCEAFSAIGMAIDGRDLYVASGTGVVFALDAVSGAIRFARRYERNGKTNTTVRNIGIQGGLMELTGWKEDIIVPYGNYLIVLATDHDKLFALDRQTGRKLWEAPRAPFDNEAEYCLGVNGNLLVCAGTSTVIAYDLVGEGRLAWVHTLGGSKSHGRGMITDDGVYIPVADSIVKLDHSNGRPVSQVGVKLPDGLPVGNLFSDGKHIFTIAMNQLHMLGSLPQHLALLNQRIEGGDRDARHDRFLLLLEAQRIDEAFADLKLLYQDLYRSDDPLQATQWLLKELKRPEFIEQFPGQTISLLTEFSSAGQSEYPLIAEASQQQWLLLVQAMNQIDANVSPDGVAAVVDAIPTMDRFELTDRARRLLFNHSDLVDSEILVQMATDNQKLYPVVFPALGRASDQASLALIRQASQADDPSIVLLGARGLVDRGEREGLDALVVLMSSDDPEVRAYAFTSLVDATRQSLEFDSLADDETRQQQIAAWRTWLGENRDTVELATPLVEAKPFLGRFIVAAETQDLIVEFSHDGTEVWRSEGDFDAPYCVQGLLNGGRVIGLTSTQEVVEVDSTGQVVWRRRSLPGPPMSIERLPSGNTLVACAGDKPQVIEIDPDGNIVWEFPTQFAPMNARRLDNGNTLICDLNNQQVLEVDLNGQVVGQIAQIPTPFSAQRLENGNTLVASSTQGSAIEFGPRGNIAWKLDGMQQIHAAVRLPSEYTVIGAADGVVIVDQDKEVVWESLEGTLVTGVSAY